MRSFATADVKDDRELDDVDWASFERGERDDEHGDGCANGYASSEKQTDRLGVDWDAEVQTEAEFGFGGEHAAAVAETGCAAATGNGAEIGGAVHAGSESPSLMADDVSGAKGADDAATADAVLVLQSKGAAAVPSALPAQELARAPS